MLDHTEADAARVTVRPTAACSPAVDPRLFGKFGEHLYTARNARNALGAGALHNPTFGSWKFQVRSPTVDGGRPATHDAETVAERVADYADARDFPDDDRMLAAYRDGLALWWLPVGDVTASPDVGRAGDRAQRVETAGDRAGVAQWCHLPARRIRDFEVDVAARARNGATLRVALHPVADDGTLGDPFSTDTLEIGDDWTVGDGALSLPGGTDPDALYGLSVTAPGGVNLVLDHVRLLPDDHRDGLDPAVVDALRDAALPLFRWPGGNFVSGYDWRDGVGPFAERPTRPNPAWDGLETNFVGTAEFLDLCERVGCEPMICVNAGDGAAAEAGDWVEYVTGDTDTEMGALRAEHGHPDPWDVTYWEVGNEVYGPWQTTWTTPEGYADRYDRFHDAMTDADPSIEVLACGNRLTDWNGPVLDAAPDRIDYLTDHVLVGDEVDADDDLTALFNDYMGLAPRVFDEYEDVAAEMAAAGVPDLRIAITELQLFARPGEGRDHDELPRSDGIAEALYAATFVHEAVRSAGRVPIITHSGVGNHGGGLRSEKARVRADPVLHYHRLGADVAGGTPLGVDLACPTYDTDAGFAADTMDLFGSLDAVSDVPVLDPIAVRDGDTLSVDLVHRDATADDRPVTVAVGDGFDPASEATVTTLTGDSMAAHNSHDDPEAVVPESESVAVRDGAAEVTVPRFGFVRVAFERAED
ncbi:MAG: alpha-L-arabinofuranosidase C-terminal domain-containing protein [Halobacteriaceae archaeon]